MKTLDQQRKWLFSVIMAVYNAEDYLEEAFESLRNQTIGFDSVQVILVDDGSGDRSGAICDRLAGRYPRSVRVIHKENGGQASARNRGIEAAEGRYLNYLDSDDRLTPETLERVAAFFAEHGDETDVVTIPMRHFEADEGEHWQNGFFRAGDRVVDLQKEFNFLQASASGAFFARERTGDIRFTEGLGFAEDTRYVMTCLARRQTIGLVGGCCYEYRWRIAGDSSSQRLTGNPNWKTRWMREYELWIINHFRERFGRIPRWVQYELLWHLGNRMKVDRTRGHTEEEAWYTDQFRQVLDVIEPEIFPAMTEGDDGIRMLLRSGFDRERKAGVRREKEAWTLTVGGEPVGEMGAWPLRLDRMEIRENQAELTGIFYLYTGMDPEKTALEWTRGGDRGRIRLNRDGEQDVTWNGYPLYDAYRFAGRAPLRAGEAQDIVFRVRAGENAEEIPAGIILGDRIPVIPVPGSTGWTGGWKYIVFDTGIHAMPCGTLPARLKREAFWCRTLLKRKQLRPLRRRIGYYAMKALGKTPGWIREAGDRSMDQLRFEEKYNADLLY